MSKYTDELLKKVGANHGIRSKENGVSDEPRDVTDEAASTGSGRPMETVTLGSCRGCGLLTFSAACCAAPPNFTERMVEPVVMVQASDVVAALGEIATTWDADDMEAHLRELMAELMGEKHPDEATGLSRPGPVRTAKPNLKTETP